PVPRAEAQNAGQVREPLPKVSNRPIVEISPDPVPRAEAQNAGQVREPLPKVSNRPIVEISPDLVPRAEAQEPELQTTVAASYDRDKIKR
ncbi:MAG: hypothetical protein ACRD72_20710, partial [Candidatus Angelobacter sp.]